ncbi:MAG: hypothetical protein HC850_01385 [Rhodomicrobium sp.]|nr:hypothetical protein [Rhodomicrobium sp.]
MYTGAIAWMLVTAPKEFSIGTFAASRGAGNYRPARGRHAAVAIANPAQGQIQRRPAQPGLQSVSAKERV